MDAAIRSFAAGGIPGPCAAVSFRRGEKAGDAGRRPGYGAADAFAGRASGQPGPGKYPPAGAEICKCSRTAGPGAWWLQRTTWISHGAGPPAVLVFRGGRLAWRTGNRGRPFLKMFRLLLEHAGLEQPAAVPRGERAGPCPKQRAGTLWIGTGTTARMETMKQALLAVSFGTSVPTRAAGSSRRWNSVLATPGRRSVRSAARTPARRSAASWPSGESAVSAPARGAGGDCGRGGGRMWLVQPTHLLYGFEYDKLKADAAAFAGPLCPAVPWAGPLPGGLAKAVRALAACMVRRCRAAGGRGVGAAGPRHGALRQHGVSRHCRRPCALRDGRRAYHGHGGGLARL